MSAIDYSGAIGRFDGDSEIYLELVETFLALTDPDFAGMRENLERGNGELVFREIHKLKGGLLTLGADGLAGTAGLLETALRTGTGGDPAALLAQAEGEYRITRAELEELRERLRTQR